MLSQQVLANSGTYNYEDHGADWTLGVCDSGSAQSPIDVDMDDVEDANEDAAMACELDYNDFSGTDVSKGMDGEHYKVSRVGGGSMGSMKTTVAN